MLLLKPTSIFKFHSMSLNFTQRTGISSQHCAATQQQFWGGSCGLLSDMRTPSWCPQKTAPLHPFLLFQWSQNRTVVRSQPTNCSPNCVWKCTTGTVSYRSYFVSDHADITASCVCTLCAGCSKWLRLYY